MELNNIRLPAEFLDPGTGRCAVILGIKPPGLPSFFMPTPNLKVLLVTVRLVTFEMCKIILEFGRGNFFFSFFFFIFSLKIKKCFGPNSGPTIPQ
jgi:hypothetical protein